jgi:hypothetical protein
VGQEYFINSQELESKVRDLLPSQGGAGAGFDLSASTQIVPIIDLTESAEGSNVREDLQTAMSHGSITAFNVENTTSTIINNTGYFRVYGSASLEAGTGQIEAQFIITDGSTDKILSDYRIDVNSSIVTYDFIVFLSAGDSLKARTNKVKNVMAGNTRQIADINGELVNPI